MEGAWLLLFDNRGYYVHDVPWRSRFGPGNNTVRRIDASQPNVVQDLIMPLGCPTALGSYDEGVGLAMAIRAVHIPTPCTAGVQ